MLDENKYDFFSDSDEELFEEEAFLKKADIGYTDSPTGLTHGVQIVLNSKYQLRDTQKIKDSKNGIKIDYEVDSFRFKIEHQREIIQIVENKSFMGKKVEIATWLPKISLKIKKLKQIQSNIKKYTEDSVDINITSPKGGATKTLQGVEKLKFLQLFVQCNALKFRFGGDKEKLGKEFLEALEKEIKEKINPEFPDFRITFKYGCPDAENDEKHFDFRTQKYTSKEEDKILVIPSDQKKGATAISSPEIERLYRRLNIIDSTLEGLEKDIYPHCGKINITLNAENGSKRLGYFLSQCKKSPRTRYDALENKTLIKECVETSLQDKGFTFKKYEYKILKDGKDTITGISVITKPSKYYLIYKYEEKRKIIQTEIDKLTNIGKSPPMVPGVRRSSLPMPTLSISRDNIYAEKTRTGTCTDEGSKAKPVLQPDTISSTC
jgi:hypothetical protein